MGVGWPGKTPAGGRDAGGGVNRLADFPVEEEGGGPDDGKSRWCEWSTGQAAPVVGDAAAHLERRVGGHDRPQSRGSWRLWGGESGSEGWAGAVCGGGEECRGAGVGSVWSIILWHYC